MIDPVDARKNREPYREANGTIVWPPYDGTGGPPPSDSETRVNNVAQDQIQSSISSSLNTRNNSSPLSPRSTVRNQP